MKDSPDVTLATVRDEATGRKRLNQNHYGLLDQGGPGIIERPLPEDDFVALWRAVVLQMFKDAANNWRTMQKPSNKARAYHNYLRAHEWLEGAWPQDFDDVCDRARLDPGWVRQRYADLKAGRITFDETMDPIDHAKAATESPS